MAEKRNSNCVLNIINIQILFECKSIISVMGSSLLRPQEGASSKILLMHRSSSNEIRGLSLK